MRYINLIILTVLLSITWGWVQNDQKISELVHTELQEELKVLITEYVQQKLPTATNLRFANVWSETIADNKIKAHFKYSFDDTNEEIGGADVLIDGFALLQKNQLAQNSVETWSLEEIQILNNHVIFKEGITLTPGSNGVPIETSQEEPSDDN